jgi:two-component system LytT family response regulator
MHEVHAIRCLVVDDEPPAREIIRRYIEQVPSLVLTGECANAIEAFTLLHHQPVDLVFLDMRMPQLNGNDFLKTLKNPPKVIFTTAYTEYAVQGYELDAVDYLLKPIPFDRFLKAVNKACQLTGARHETHAAPEETRNDSFVYFRADRKMVKVVLDDILYIESMKDYIKIITKTGMIIKKFIRTHRSFIVSLDKIKSFTSELIDIAATEVPVGKLYRNAVMKVLG